MKAKEYAQRIIDVTTYNKSPEAIEAGIVRTSTDVLIDLVQEAEGLIKTRHPKCNAAYVAIFDELNNKWLKICEIVDKYFQDFTNSEIHILKKDYFSETLLETFEKHGYPYMRMMWKPRRQV